MKMVPVEIRQVQNMTQDEEFQKLYDALRGRLDLEKPILLRDPQEHPNAVEDREATLERSGNTLMSGKYIPEPPVRVPFGEGRISLIEGAVPVSGNTYRISGERESYTRKWWGT